jgi:hypothetical protein
MRRRTPPISLHTAERRTLNVERWASSQLQRRAVRRIRELFFLERMGRGVPAKSSARAFGVKFLGRPTNFER